MVNTILELIKSAANFFIDQGGILIRQTNELDGNPADSTSILLQLVRNAGGVIQQRKDETQSTDKLKEDIAEISILHLIKAAAILIRQRGDATAQLKELSEALAAITALNLNCKGIDDAEITGLAVVLKTNTTLTSLKLFDNNIGDAGMAALADALTTNATLTELDLDYNIISVAGVEVLAAALKVNATLTELDLSANSVGDAGIKALAGALKLNTRLTSLNLGQNNISATGMEVLAEVLKTNTTLTSLKLLDNNIGDAGIAALAEALQTNTTLTSLNLYGNKVSDAGIKAKFDIHLKIKANKKLAKCLIKAAQDNDLAAVKLYVNKGASVNYQDEDGNTALHHAAKHLNPAMIDYLYGLPQQSIHLKNKQGEVVDARLFKRGYDFGDRYVHFFRRPIRVEQIPKKHYEAYKPDVMICTV